MAFTVGSLVRVREREWVVLPDSDDEFLMVRPLGGTEDEVTGIYLPLEHVEPASFALPDPSQRGDYRSGRLLRDAVRLGFRSSAGPFRSFARIAVEPRPYQLVPLLMALKLDPVRLLIADDVGIGKTVEAMLIARELLDRGEIQRMAILCPPYLAEQWQNEVRDKFHIEAELVLASTAPKLERRCRLGQSLFEVYPFVIVSTDFIKSEHRRDEFVRTCPELVIVDEAHTCAWAGEGRDGNGLGGSSRHQRHHLVKSLAAAPHRHVVLVTATPHSGNEAAFRSLLTILKPAFADLPEDLSGSRNEHHRRHLANHFVQRQRGDIRHYMQESTPFPKRQDSETTYHLSEAYRRLFQRVIRYAREMLQSDGGQSPSGSPESPHRRRVLWWSVLALLRSLASSPAAAAATLRNRAASADTQTVEEADSVGRRTVFDLMDDESAEGVDLVPGSDIGEQADDEEKHHRRLLDMAREAERLMGANDHKVQQMMTFVDSLLADGFHPIVFCRFIPTAEYVAAALRDHVSSDTEVVAVTGTLPPAEREARVALLSQSPRRVLVATDCLSEGINLQEHFSAVIHYDLSWNPTRHEQRAGRVDRYGQPSPYVQVWTYYGTDNQIDGVVLDVLLRKHQQIRTATGVSVPVPTSSDQVMEAILEGLLLRGKPDSEQLLLPGMEDVVTPHQEHLFHQWDDDAKRHTKRSRTMYAQERIKPDEVMREWQTMRDVIGSGVDVAKFVRDAVVAHGGIARQQQSSAPALVIDTQGTPAPLRDALAMSMRGKQRAPSATLTARFALPIQSNEVYLSRTHPFVAGLATYVMDMALDTLAQSVAQRCGVVTTRQVARRTTLLLLRFRYHIVTKATVQGNPTTTLLAEDCLLVGFTGTPERAVWLRSEEAEAVLLAEPDANTPSDKAAHFLNQVLGQFEALHDYLNNVAIERGHALLDAHRRVRDASAKRGITYEVEPHLPPDVLGVYVYLPENKT